MKLIQENNQEVDEVVGLVQNSGLFYENIWFWIAVLELAVICFMLFKLYKMRQLSDLTFNDVSKKDLRRKVKNSNVDMSNLMDSINNSKDLYKQLSRTCHPDRFINTDKHSSAEEIFQNISKNKRNYQKLLEIKEEAINKLNLKIN